jgi:hypothetical protein
LLTSGGGVLERARPAPLEQSLPYKVK